jgi:hypothetical protein
MSLDDGLPHVPPAVSELFALPGKNALSWMRNAPDMAQVRGTPEQLKTIHDWLLSLRWTKGIAGGRFNMTLSNPADPESFAILTVYRKEDIAFLQLVGAPIADVPTAYRGR